VAAGKTTAADLGAYICFEDEAGQGLRPPKGRSWAPRGQPPLFEVRGGGRGWVSVAGVLCVRPGARAHLFYRLRPWRGRRGERRSFAWTDYRDLIVLVHQQLGAPLVWVWDNLNVHSTGELSAFIAENTDWLRVFHLPSYAPDLNPTEGVWSLLKRSLANLAAANLDHLIRVVKRKLKKIQYRPHLLEGCLAETGLTLGMP
jgi:transposase